jgi:hypothetical protein
VLRVVESYGGRAGRRGWVLRGRRWRRRRRWGGMSGGGGWRSGAGGSETMPPRVGSGLGLIGRV